MNQSIDQLKNCHEYVVGSISDYGTQTIDV